MSVNECIKESARIHQKILHYIDEIERISEQNVNIIRRIYDEQEKRSSDREAGRK